MGWATSQVQLVLSLQDGFLQAEPTQVSPDLQSEVTEQELLHDTSVGVGVAVTQLQSVLDVQDGFRHMLPEQTRSDLQSAFVEQE